MIPCKACKRPIDERTEVRWELGHPPDTACSLKCVTTLERTR